MEAFSFAAPQATLDADQNPNFGNHKWAIMGRLPRTAKHNLTISTSSMLGFAERPVRETKKLSSQSLCELLKEAIGEACDCPSRDTMDQIGTIQKTLKAQSP